MGKSIQYFSIMLFLITTSTSAFNYYANFDTLFDGEDYYNTGDGTNFIIEHGELSGNGNRIAFAGEMMTSGGFKFDYKLFIIDFDGTNLLEIPLPADPSPNRDTVQVSDIAINEDGSRIFIMTEFTQHIYKIDITENPIVGQVSLVGDMDALHLEFSHSRIKTIATGDWVYYSYYRSNTELSDIFRLSHTGGTPQIVIEETSVPVTIATGGSGTGRHIIDSFDVSDDGNEILFALFGYTDNNGTYQTNWSGWFTKTAGGYTQLTPTDVDGLDYGVISGDGSKVVFTDFSASGKYISSAVDGSNRLLFEDQSYNNSGLSITQDGSKLFYADNAAQTGRFSFTNFVNIGKPLMSDSGAYTLVNRSAGVSNNGTRVAYIGNYRSAARTRLYGGILNPELEWTAQGPTIANIVFSPTNYYDQNIPVVLTTSPVVTGAVAHISNVSLRNGRYYTDSNGDTWSHGFTWRRDPVDNGFPPDNSANDGEYTREMSINKSYSDEPVCNIVVRVAVGDTQGNVTVADKVLNGSPECIYQNAFESY